MKQDLYSNEWISTEIQSAEINPQAYRGEVFLIVSLKTLFQNLHPVKSYVKTNPTDFVFSLREKYRWGFTSFGQYNTCNYVIILLLTIVVSFQILL